MLLKALPLAKAIKCGEQSAQVRHQLWHTRQGAAIDGFVDFVTLTVDGRQQSPLNSVQ